MQVLLLELGCVFLREIDGVMGMNLKIFWSIDPRNKITDYIKAKEIFGEVVLIKSRFDAEYLVDATFNNEMFKGGRYLIIK